MSRPRDTRQNLPGEGRLGALRRSGSRLGGGPTVARALLDLAVPEGELD